MDDFVIEVKSYMFGKVGFIVSGIQGPRTRNASKVRSVNAIDSHTVQEFISPKLLHEPTLHEE